MPTSDPACSAAEPASDVRFFAQREYDDVGTMDAALNVSFFVLHTAWIAFNCLGWIWRRTRPWQLATVSLTAFSWFALGAWYGWGYCPCTDWHWQVRARLGHQDPSSYIQLLIRELTGLDPGAALADTLAVATLAGVTLLNVVLYTRDRRAPRDRASLTGTRSG